MNDDHYLVLLFHSIDDRDLLSFRNLGNIRPDLFEKVVVSLKKEFDIVSLEEVIGCVSGKKERRGRVLAVTFDDGPKSYAASAAPIMESLEIPSTCFLITDCIGDERIYWRYLYNFCLQRGRGKDLAALINREYAAAITENDVICFTREHFSRKKTGRIIENIVRRFGPGGQYRIKEQGLFLSFDDIEILKKNPLVSFGIHTRTHPVMSHLSDTEIFDEISGSLDFYKKNISDNTPMFSIPFGRLDKDYDGRAVKIARDLSIEVILSAYGGGNRRGQPLFNIRRIPVYENMLKNGPSSFISLLKNLCSTDDYASKEKRLYNAMA
jgi:peptidoglycan/xylan/chitin deacetylase (PgdA/CDA1 family)